MSYQFNHNGNKYWAKQGKTTEVHLLEKKGLSEVILTLNGRIGVEKVVAALDGGAVRDDDGAMSANRAE